MKRSTLFRLVAFVTGLSLALLVTLQPRHALAQYGGTCPAGNGLFVLYYGAVQSPASEDPTLQTIISKQPNFIVFGSGLQDRSDIPSYVHQNGGRALQYIPLGYGNKSDAEIDTLVSTAMNVGYDGVFFDETETDPAMNKHEWNMARAAHVRSFGVSKLVIINPGIVSPPSSVFDYADIVSVENQYNQVVPSYPGIPSWRWLAVQGQPANQAAQSAQDAQNRTTTFRDNGGFWYYSSNYDLTRVATHIDLPPWYATFADWVKAQPGPSCSGLTNPQATNDATNLYYSFQYSGKWDYYQVFIDTDQNSSTGFAIGGIGADYLLEKGWLYQHGGGEWNWTPLKTVSYSNTNSTASWTVLRADLGEIAPAETTDLIFKVGDSGGNGPSLPKFTHNYSNGG